MDTAQKWKECFTNWPEKIGRRGVLVTSLGEQIPFNEFMTSDSLLLIDRTLPDTVGTRKLLIPYESIALLKIIDIVDREQFLPLGFEGRAPKR